MRAAAAFAALACLAATPSAAADTIESLYGNTLEVRYPSGGVERFYVDADGGFAMVMTSGQRVEARWTQQDGQFCVLVEQSPPGCSAFPADKSVGDSWEQQSDTGVVHYAIIEGR